MMSRYLLTYCCHYFQRLLFDYYYFSLFEYICSSEQQEMTDYLSFFIIAIRGWGYDGWWWWWWFFLMLIITLLIIFHYFHCCFHLFFIYLLLLLLDIFIIIVFIIIDDDDWWSTMILMRRILCIYRWYRYDDSLEFPPSIFSLVVFSIYICMAIFSSICLHHSLLSLNTFIQALHIFSFTVISITISNRHIISFPSSIWVSHEQQQQHMHTLYSL